MDIAKYAGLFFNRSEYVYLPGLGNLEIKKSPSAYSSEFGTINPATAEIIFKPTIGVIDDSFANFVANNERVSIASAANAIADFAKHAKAEIFSGNTVEIPGIGRFINNDGKVGFEVSESFEYVPKSIPVFKNVSKTEPYQKEKGIHEIIENTPYRELSGDDEVEMEKVKINYGKLIALILTALIILGGIGYLIYSLATGSNSDNATEQTTGRDLDAPPTAPVVVDSARIKDSLANAGIVKIIVNEYTQISSAEARQKKLSSINYDAEVVNRGDSIYFVIVKFPISEKGAQFLADSIKPVLNPRFNVRLLD